MYVMVTHVGYAILGLWYVQSELQLHDRFYESYCLLGLL
jgi:hypothetical protein